MNILNVITYLTVISGQKEKKLWIKGWQETQKSEGQWRSQAAFPHQVLLSLKNKLMDRGSIGLMVNWSQI